MVRFIALALAALAAPAAAIGSQSRLGQKLLAKAEPVDRKLNDERDISWLPNMSIKFDKCYSLVQVSSEENGGDGEGQGLLYTQHLIEFSLCPSDSCNPKSNSCKNGAKYVTNMRDFMEIYMQYKEEEKEQACEAVRENCNNDDEDYCFNEAGMTQCIEVEGEEQEEWGQFMECENLENNGNNNNGNYYREFFVGPYCASNGQAIHLGVFLDEGCSVPAEEGVYESMNYGRSLPYSTDSLIEAECISCEQVDEDANNNNNNNGNNNNNNDDAEPEIIELCEQMYEQAARCESNLDIQYPDQTGCDFINNALPKLEGVSKSLGVYTGPNSAAVICAWVFGVLAFALGIYSFLLYRRLRRSKVALNEQEVGNTKPVA